METSEAKSAIKALYLQAASLAALEVSRDSPEYLVAVVERGFRKVSRSRRPEAVANLLGLLAEIIYSAQLKNLKVLGEGQVQEGHDRVCPIYPFAQAPRSPAKRRSVKR